jgi:4-amino-4-deoxy-L-arabinose transferase-like glycosyltransferase
MRGRRSNIAIALALAAVTLCLRLPDFFRTVASANEGLYAVVARELLHGHLPYLTAWEAKPPLFFAAIALAMRVVGPSLLAIRLVSTLAACVATIAIFSMGLRFPRHGRAIGVLAAVLYAALMASNSGTSGEAEVLYAACTALAVAFVLPAFAAHRRLGLLAALGAGLCAGFALQMKVTAALDAAFVLALIAYAARDLKVVLASIAAAAFPNILGFAPYAFTGNTAFYLDANVWTVTRRLGEPVAHVVPLRVLREQLQAFFPAWILALGLPAAWARASADERRIVTVLALWAATAVATLLAIREFFGYQWLPLVAPVSLLAAWTLVRLVQEPSLRRWCWAIATLAVIAHGTGRYARLGERDDNAVLAQRLNALAKPPGAWLYVASGDPALYLLIGAPIPTRYPYPQHLYATDMERAAGVDGAREIRAVFARQPAYVVFSLGEVAPNPRLRLIEELLQQQYVPLTSVGGQTIYVRSRS